jgi:hypothetical protein
VGITKAEETYAAIGKLLEAGMRLSDAVRQIAADNGRSEAAVRASYYNQRSRLGLKGDSRRGGQTLSVEDAINEAKQLLERALVRIDSEVEVAKAKAEAAEAQYEALKTSADERRSELERKIAAL